MNNRYLKIISTATIALFLICCENKTLTTDQYIDSQIIFSSRRWWNYDIFIADVTGGNLNHITKNRSIDFNPAISPDAKTLGFISDRDGNREIYLCDLEWLDGYSQWRANNLRNLTNTEQNEWTPIFSPVEEKIAFSTYFPDNDNYDIFIMDLDGSNKENLTKSDVYEKFPQFSKDGSFIIFQGWQKGKMEIFLVGLLDKEIINMTKSVTSNDIISHGNSFSANSQNIVFTSDRNGNRDIYSMDINGDKLEQITTNSSNDYEPIYSPDGESIIFTSERDGNKEIYKYFISNKNIKNLTNNPFDDWNPRYYPDGSKIVFQSLRDGDWEIYNMNYDGSNQRNLSNHPSTDYSYIIFQNYTQ